MAAKIFATGATGYIGGAALDAIINSHPEYLITALVRNEVKADLVKKKYPKITTVQGDLDSVDILNAEAQKADIVLHFADADHKVAAKTFVDTLSSSPTKKYLISTSGSAILDSFLDPTTFGKPIKESQVYSDIDSIRTITSFPEEGHPHRNVDKIILAAPPNLNFAIVCPPTIYGVGTGPVNTRSAQIPELIRQILKRGKAFTVNGGKNVWNNVHISDLSKLYLYLTEAAVRGGEGADWNESGYYFAENGEHCWGDVAQKISSKAKELGYISSDEVDHLGIPEVTAIHPFGPLIWGLNSIGKADRARKFGWKPTGPSLEETFEEEINNWASELKV